MTHRRAGLPPHGHQFTHAAPGSIPGPSTHVDRTIARMLRIPISALLAAREGDDAEQLVEWGVACG